MDFKEIIKVSGDIMPRMENGAFLTVRSHERSNTMTIGWAMMGICWRKPILMIAVRNSRYTFGIMEEALDFTVSIPSGNLRDEIFYCGTKSGREVDKLKECGLSLATGKKVVSPIIDTAGLHLECQIVYKNAVDPDALAPDYHTLYPEGDFHTLYYGEILACYEIG